MAHLSDAVYDLLNKSAGVGGPPSSASINAKASGGHRGSHSHHEHVNLSNDPSQLIIKRNRFKVQCIGAHLLERHEGACRCSTCIMGVGRAAWKGIEPQCQSCDSHDSPSVIMIPVDQRECPLGTLPWDVFQIKTNLIFKNVWSCLGIPETVCFLDFYSDYQICNKPMSVLMAATHFLLLHTQINANFGLAMSRQASLGRGVSPVHPALLSNRGIIESTYGSNHFSYTSFGLNYMDMRKSMSALVGQAWGH